jgi:diguanylate cyclase (GGDEF)-like protein
MPEGLLRPKNGLPSIARMVGVIACAVFVAALALMWLQSSLARADLVVLPVAVLGSIVLGGLAAALAYGLAYLPVKRHYEEQASAEVVPTTTIREESITDPLTRTLNRRGVTVGLLDLMAMADRYGHQLAVAMVDIDHLGEVNDKYGKTAGDQVLASVGSVLADALRMPDRVGRYSDNEFLLILPETSLQSACGLAERIRKATADTSIDIDGDQIQTTISVGVTAFRKGEDLDHLVSRAEAAIREAKSSGRNCIVCNEPK